MLLFRVGNKFQAIEIQQQIVLGDVINGALFYNSGVLYEQCTQLSIFPESSIIDVVIAVKGGINIYVRQISGKLTPIEVKDQLCTVAELKSKIFVIEGIEVENQALYANGKLMSDYNSLQYYEINADSIIHLINNVLASVDKESSEPFQVIIQSENANKSWKTLPLGDKTKVTDLFGLAGLNGGNLFHKGKVLQRECALEDYNVSNGDVITHLLKSY